MERTTRKAGFSLWLLFAGGAGTALAVGCGSGDEPDSGLEKPTAQVALALSPCDPSGPFEPPTAAFTGTAIANGVTFTPNGTTAYVSAKIPPATTSEIYSATYSTTTNSFGSLTPLAAGTGINGSATNEGPPSVTADGSRLYFGRYVSSGLRFQLLVSRWGTPTAGQWNTPLTLPTPPNSIGALHDQDPFFYSPAADLYFASEPSEGTRDLRVAHVTFGMNGAPDGYGSVSTLQVDAPGTTYDEYRPVVSPDGLTLYFSSSHPGIGDDTGGDIWMVKRSATNVAFTSAGLTNLSNLNTSRVEYPAGISNDGCTLYFASNRETTATQDFRLYQAKRGSSDPGTVSSTLKIVGTGSVTTAGYQCSGTCIFQGTPNTTATLVASDQAIWSGSCAANGSTPNHDGTFVYSHNGVCTVTFPNGSAQPQGGGCTSPAGCQSGLECTLNTCRCAPGSTSCTCTPDCAGKACGTDDGCGGFCPCGPQSACDPAAPFNPPLAAFTRTTIADGLAFSQDGLKAYVSAKAGPGNSDIYFTQRGSVTQPFNALQALAIANLNSVYNERAPSLSADGSSLYFSKLNPSNGWSEDLAVANLQANTWSYLVNANSSVYDQDPFALSSQNQLYYASERPSGVRDIYVCPLGSCTVANSTALSINSQQEDFRPVLSRDGRTLYFTSTRAGIGGDTEGDIWIATRPRLDQPFSPVTSLAGLSGSYGERPVALSSDGCTLYFASNRDTGNSAEFRLYQATRGTSVPPTVTTAIKIVGSGSITTSGYQCSANCSFQGSPESTVYLQTSAQALWSGSCTRYGNGPTSSDGLLVFTNGGTCTITFPNGGPQPAGGGCTSPAGCQSGLECTLNVCQCPPGSTGCTSCAGSCTGKVCGDYDGCGNVCCGQGGACTADSDCAGGRACINGTCAPPECADNPFTLGCGTPSSFCPKCTKNPVCTSNADCSGGLVCPANNGARYGLPGQRVCEDPLCATQPAVVGCGLVTSACGLCPDCVPNCAGKQCGATNLDNGCGGLCTGLCADGQTCTSNVDCSAGSVCLNADLGCTGSSCARVCRPAAPCASPVVAAPSCGSASAVCGPRCPPASSGSCLDRVCGSDPYTGASCGSCATNQQCSTSGRCSPVDTYTPIGVPAGPGANPPMRTVTPRPSLPGVSVGTIEGLFSVTDRGSASYTIPIVVPPGRMGVEPNVTLSYVSRTANGAVGVGWSLGGFSSITLCRKTYALDGIADSPGTVDILTAPLCLDGQRLRTSDGVNFRTEAESFTKIVATPSSGGNVFTVRTRDGLIHTYGGGATSQASGYLYALSETRDRSNNFIKYTYRPVPHREDISRIAELLPAAITYTGSGSTDGDREIVFKYDDAVPAIPPPTRPDVLVGYGAGNIPVQRSRILKNIEVRARNSLVRRYELTYDYELPPPEPRRAESHLRMVKECAPSAVCKPATEFQYYDDMGFEAEQVVAAPPATVGIARPLGLVTRWSPQDKWNLSTRSPLLGLRPEMERRSDRINASWGSDGIPVYPFPGQFGQAMVVVGAFGNYPTVLGAGLLWNAIRSDGGSVDRPSAQYEFSPLFRDSTLPPYVYDDSEPDAPRQRVVVEPTGGESIFDWYSNDDMLWFIDLDGDGVQDRLYCGPNWEGILRYELANAKNAPLDVHPSIPASAGRPISPPFGELGDLCRPQVSFGGSNIKSVPSMAFDVNGDGAQNLLIDDPNQKWAMLDWERIPSIGGGYVDAPVWRTDRTAELSNHNIRMKTHHPIPIDANGDGLRDLLALPSAATLPSYIAINTGSGFKVKTLSSPDPADLLAPMGKPMLIVDLDGDGAEELMETPIDPNNLRTRTEWTLRKIRGSTIVREPVPGGLLARIGSMGDFDGDGNLDLLALGQDNNTHALYRGRGRKNGLLQSVTDGLGRRTEVSYENVNQYGEMVFDSGLGQDPPVVDPSCRWPYRCSEVVENTLVSLQTEGYYTSLARGTGAPFQNTRSFDYNYKGSRSDLAGHGWLGFWERRIRTKNAWGMIVSDKTITYQPPELWSTSSTIPYVHTRAGLEKDTVVKTPLGFSSITLNQESLTTETHNTWQTLTSVNARPYPFMTRSVETVRGAEGTSAGEVLFTRDTTFAPDDSGYGNTKLVSTDSFDGEGAGITGSHTITKVERAYDSLDPGAWLISRRSSETITSVPRCTGAACGPLTRVSTAEFTYYPGTALPEYVRANLADPELRLTTRLVRDGFGNVTRTERTGASGPPRVDETVYDGRGLFPTSTRRVGAAGTQTTQLRHDDRFGTLTIRVDPNGIDETWSYDEWGTERDYTGPGGNRSATPSAGGGSYVVQGLQVITTSAVSSRHDNGVDSVLEYNAFGQMVRRSTPGYDGQTVTEEFVYDGNGLLRQRARPHIPGDTTQGVVTYDYDVANRPVQVTQPDGGTTIHQHALARFTGAPEWTHAFGHFVNKTGVKTASEQFLVSSELNDRDQHPVRTIDGLGKRTHYFYGAFGRLRETIDPAGLAVYTDHDARGRVTSVTDAARGGAETMHYNGFGDLTGTSDAANRARTLIYDDFGRLAREEVVQPGKPAEITRRFYDGDGTRPNEIGRLVRTESPSGQIVTFGYEAPRANRNSGLMNRVGEHLVAPGSPSTTRDFVTSYTFNDAAQLTRIDYPSAFGTAVAVDYAYDMRGHLMQVTDGNSSGLAWWQYCGSYKGLRVDRERLVDDPSDCSGPGNDDTLRVYDDRTGALVGTETIDWGVTRQSLAYGYDLAGRMIHREDRLSQFVEDFDYDSVSRLTHVNNDQKYTYDSQGRNRLVTLKSERGTRSYGYYADAVGRDWVQSAGSFSFAHDQVGNITQKTKTNFQQTFEYTPFDLPKKITTTENGVAFDADFAYDANRSRVVKKSSNGTTFYSQDLFQEIQAPNGSRRARALIYAGGRPIAQLDIDETGAFVRRALLDDALGSIRTVVTGTSSEYRDFSPFGEQRNDSSSFAGIPFGFTGHEEDKELGVVNMRGRIYDPELAQFLQADPRTNDGPNRFAYVRNSPLNYVDPSGTTAWLAGGAIAGLGPAGAYAYAFSKRLDLRLAELNGGRDLGDWLKVGAQTFAGTLIARNWSGPSLMGSDWRAFHGGLNGFLAGYHEIYDWKSLDSWEAFALDSTNGIAGTGLGNFLVLTNEIFYPRPRYSPELSKGQNRQVYLAGFSPDHSGAAHTQGNVTSNLDTHDGDHGAGLLNHETEHIRTNRKFGSFFTGSYAAWAVFGTVYALGTTEGTSFGEIGRDIKGYAYYSNPWEAHAYCANNPDAWDPEGGGAFNVFCK